MSEADLPPVLRRYVCRGVDGFAILAKAFGQGMLGSNRFVVKLAICWPTAGIGMSMPRVCVGSLTRLSRVTLRCPGSAGRFGPSAKQVEGWLR
jgi:hypothetical protein